MDKNNITVLYFLMEIYMSEKAEKTREKILDTAIKHFLRDGFSGASLRGIVKDAGLTTGAFYKYYPN